MLSDEQYPLLVKSAAWLATAIALLLVVLKLWAWMLSDAHSLLASATDSFLDLFVSIINLMILRIALRPADNDHRFGHGKAEPLAGLVQAAFVIGSAGLLLFTGVERLINPVVLEKTMAGIVVSVLAIGLTLLLVVYQKWVIKQTNSVAISADSLHYQSDLLLNLGVLLALYLSQAEFLYADGIFTCLVGLYLGVGALKILWLSIDHIMDKSLPENELDIIAGFIEQDAEAMGFHELRTRMVANKRYIQFHLQLADDLSLQKAHSIGHRIESRIIERFTPCEVLIHHDPISVVEQELKTEQR